MMFLYIVGKLTILIIMLVNVQKKYNLSWELNTCDHLQHMIKFWIIWNYIMVSATGIFFFAYIGICICDDEYDEYDDESDDLCPCC